MNETFCRPKWFSPSAETKYKAIQVPKDSNEVEDVFATKHLDSLSENYVWKIITSREPVYRSQQDFNEQFNIVGKE
jgi:hypothetical protein